MARSSRIRILTVAGATALALALAGPATAASDSSKSRDFTVTGTVVGKGKKVVVVKTKSGVKVRCSRAHKRTFDKAKSGKRVKMTCRSSHGKRFAIRIGKPSSSSSSSSSQTDRVKVRGLLKSVDSTTNTVVLSAGPQDVTCTVPAGTDLSGFTPGQPVEARCSESGDTLALTRLRTEDRDRGKITVYGMVDTTSSGGSSVTVTAGGLTVTCNVPSSLRAVVSALVSGARMEVECYASGDSLVLHEIEIEDGVAPGAQPGDENEIEVKGTLTLGEGTATVGSTTCNVTDPALLGTVENGDFVEMKCKAGNLVRIEQED